VVVVVGRGRLVVRDGGGDLEENLGGAKLQQQTVVRIKGQRNKHRKYNGYGSLRGIIMMLLLGSSVDEGIVCIC